MEDQARAFEIAVSERLADQWADLQTVTPEVVILSGPVDKLMLYRHLLSPFKLPERRAALMEVLASRYRKNWEWIHTWAEARQEEGGCGTWGGAAFLDQFLARLDIMAPLPEGGDTQWRQVQEELARLQAKLCRQETEQAALKQDLEFAEDRASRAHQRLRQVEVEAQQLRKQLREERENGEKLRLERTRRIQLDRQSSEATRELAQVRQEYLKLERRLQEMARRLVQAKQQGSPDPSLQRIGLETLRQVSVHQLLGLEGSLTPEKIGRARRRFALVFHSDRVNQLPAWVSRLFDEVLGIVNEACDRAGK